MIYLKPSGQSLRVRIYIGRPVTSMYIWSENVNHFPFRKVKRKMAEIEGDIRRQSQSSTPLLTTFYTTGLKQALLFSFFQTANLLISSGPRTIFAGLDIPCISVSPFVSFVGNSMVDNRPGVLDCSC